MSKIINGGLTQSGTGWQQWASKGIMIIAIYCFGVVTGHCLGNSCDAMKKPEFLKII